MIESKKINAGNYEVTLNGRVVGNIFSPQRNDAATWSFDFGGDFYFLTNIVGNMIGATKRSVLAEIRDFDFAPHVERADLANR